MKSTTSKLQNIFSNPVATPTTGAEYRAQIDAQMTERLSAYDAYCTRVMKVSLAEAFEAGLDGTPINLFATSKGGYPAVIVGDPDAKGNPLKMGKSGLNAIVALVIGKYQPDPVTGVYERFYREAFFDPRINPIGVVSEKVSGGVYRFKDFENGDFVATRMNDARRVAQTSKHNAIDQLLHSIKYGSAAQFVMWNDDLENHFVKTVKDRLEMQLIDVNTAIGEDYKSAKINRALTTGNAVDTRVEPSEDNLSIAKELAALQYVVVIKYQVDGSPNIDEIEFDPTNEATRQGVLDSIVHSRWPLTVLGYEAKA
jgi:hypothetical protein